MKQKFEKTLNKVDKLTNTPYLDLYYYNYTINGKQSHYYVASRRKPEDLAIYNVGKVEPDCVRIIPYFKKDDKIFVVLTREFRQPINDFVYSTPAGRIEFGEDAKTCAVRELEEEIGCTVKKLDLMVSPSFSSVGLTDECIIVYSAEIELTSQQNLQDCETIERFPIELKDLKRFAEEEIKDFQAKTILTIFYYETMFNIKKK